MATSTLAPAKSLAHIKVRVHGCTASAQVKSGNKVLYRSRDDWDNYGNGYLAVRECRLWADSNRVSITEVRA